MATAITIPHPMNPEQTNTIPRRLSHDGDFSSRASAGSSSSDLTTSASITLAGEIVGVSENRKESSVSRCSVEMVDLETGFQENAAHLDNKNESDCRICHMSLDSGNEESGGPIELGCSCKDDLAAAHRHCAEAWFKIRGNKTCEICGSIARNVAGSNEAELLEQWNEANDAANAAVAAVAAAMAARESRNFWQGHPELLTGMYGICLCDIMVVSFQCSFMRATAKRYSVEAKHWK